MGVVRVIVAVLILTAPAFAEERISLDTFRGIRVGFAPATIEVKIHVPRHPDNRKVCIQFVSDIGMVGHSCYDYDGDSMMVRPYLMKELSEGEYAVKAWLYAAETDTQGARKVKEYPSNLLMLSIRGSSSEP